MLRIKAHECSGLLQRSDFVFLAVACGSLSLAPTALPGWEEIQELWMETVNCMNADKYCVTIMDGRAVLT